LGGSKLRDEAVDAAVVANVLFQIEHKQEFIAEVRRVLKPKGRLLLVDWKSSFGGLGPTALHIISEPVGRRLFESSGFSFERSVNAGVHHWGAVMRKM